MHNINIRNNKLQSYQTDELWNGELMVEWNDVNGDVNILVGVNGCGKTTLLNAIYSSLLEEGASVIYLKCLDNPARDNEKLESALLQELKYIAMENDDNYSFTNYRLQMLDQPERHDQVQERLSEFYAVVNRLFAETGKEILVEKGRMAFRNKRGTIIPLEQLSSGEKQILIILLKVFLMDEKPAIILMDEPELSMDIDWQFELLDILVKMNPNAQFILTTHAPSIFGNGWGDKVVYLEDVAKTSDNEER